MSAPVPVTDPGADRKGVATLSGLGEALFTVCLAGIVLSTLPRLVGGLHWSIDNATAASLQLFGGVCVFGLVALARRRWKAALAAAAAALIQITAILPALGDDARLVDGSKLSWLVANVHGDNLDHDALLALIEARRPHVIGLTEMNRRWLAAVDGPLEAYRHRVVAPREDYFGIGLFSRVPLAQAGLRDFGLTPTIGATVALGDREVDLLLIHVVPPVTTAYVEARNDQLRALGRLRPRPGAGLVLAGDFNVAPFSPVFRDNFLRRGFRRTGTLIGTWPANVPAPMRVPIDHALVAGDVAARSAVERPIHSDHLPLWIELGGAPAAVAAHDP